MKVISLYKPNNHGMREGRPRVICLERTD